MLKPDGLMFVATLNRSAKAFGLATIAGRLAYLSRIAGAKNSAQASSPLTGFLYEK